MDNPLSKTHLEFTKDRIQHYSHDTYACTGCENQYHPKVHSQPYIIQFGTITSALILASLLLTQSKIWLYLTAIFVIFIALPHLYFYSKKERNISTGKLKYGDIVLECPKCGGINANKIL